MLRDLVLLFLFRSRPATRFNSLCCVIICRLFNNGFVLVCPCVLSNSISRVQEHARVAVSQPTGDAEKDNQNVLYLAVLEERERTGKENISAYNKERNGEKKLVCVVFRNLNLFRRALVLCVVCLLLSHFKLRFAVVFIVVIRYLYALGCLLCVVRFVQVNMQAQTQATQVTAPTTETDIPQTGKEREAETDSTETENEPLLSRKHRQQQHLVITHFVACGVFCCFVFLSVNCCASLGLFCP